MTEWLTSDWSSHAGDTPVCMKFRIIEKVWDQIKINIDILLAKYVQVCKLAIFSHDHHKFNTSIYAIFGLGYTT